MLGYTRGAWATPIRPSVITPPPAPPRVSVAPVTTPQVIRATMIPQYDPGRIFKDIKVVSDLRQSGTERGEVQTGDDGFLGPGSIDPQEGLPAVTPEVAKNPLVPIALVIAAFFLFGG